MSDHDRGAYSPQSEAPLAFDARRSSPGGGGGRGPAPMTLIVSAVVLILLIVALFIFYRSGARSAGDAPQPVGDAVAQMKTPPAAPAASAPANGLQVYSDDAAKTESGSGFAPAPEQPGARPVVAPAPSAPVATTPLPAAPSATAPTTVAPTKPAAAATAQPKPAAPVPVIAQPKPATTTPATTKPSTTTASAGGGHALVQIGAFSSAALADKGWSDVAGVLPGQMAGKSKRVETVDRDGQTFYRTFVGGFDSKAEADAFCASLKAKGKTCLVK